ncbi:MAG: HAD family hydrolase [Prevotella conceptionensis]|jgi:hypothetical protein|uniref:HAD family hydrolase n=1 Tax=Prevotella conceptionensis TaxID=340486 RepID=UPI000312DCAD|nr:HAD family phosphatase [Prevotella conceptionensis]
MSYKKAALFDLDGVVFDTEPQYTAFWSTVFARHYPNEPQLATSIKGQTLTWIYERYFADKPDLQNKITAELNTFERNMQFEYVLGFEDFIAQLHQLKVNTAVVTSSNKEKMQQVYDQHPNFKALFDHVFTAEDFAKSKPDPYCYLLGASYFGVRPTECVAFEDSTSGFKSVKSAGMPLVGLATSNSVEVINQYTKVIIPNYLHASFADLCNQL